jgi:nitrous oxidase accessory protein NosD
MLWNTKYIVGRSKHRGSFVFINKWNEANRSMVKYAIMGIKISIELRIEKNTIRNNSYKNNRGGINQKDAGLNHST